MKKQGKKLMLVVLALLAVVTVALPLVGCKNDSVAEPVRYTVTFNSNGGTGTMNPQPFTAGVAQELAANAFTRTGFVFVGWSEDSKATSATYGDKAKFTATKDTALYAVWSDKILTFTSDSDTHLKVSFNGSIEVPDGMAYSTDGENWTPFTKETGEISFGQDTKLYLRGKSSTGTAQDTSNYVNFTFKDGTKVYASGDIRTLVDWNDPVNAVTSKARFTKLFMDCDELVTAPELPAKTLADSCYESMFRGCTGLETAPELPATNLAVGCYKVMFRGCTSLETAPELKAPSLAAGCYADMFSGCTGLTTAPELPAETLVLTCYMRMFADCTNLASVTMLATNVRANDALRDWLYNTAWDGTGTLYVDNDIMKEDEIIKDSLPENWTVEVKTN